MTKEELNLFMMGTSAIKRKYQLLKMMMKRKNKILPNQNQKNQKLVKMIWQKIQMGKD